MIDMLIIIKNIISLKGLQILGRASTLGNCQELNGIGALEAVERQEGMGQVDRCIAQRA